MYRIHLFLVETYFTAFPISGGSGGAQKSKKKKCRILVELDRLIRDLNQIGSVTSTNYLKADIRTKCSAPYVSSVIITLKLFESYAMTFYYLFSGIRILFQQ